MAFYKCKDKTEFFPTPQENVDYMWDNFFPEELKHLDRPVEVLDICTGTGALCNPTRLPCECNFHKYDLVPRTDDTIQFDALNGDWSTIPECDIAVLNPPFKYKNEFVDLCLTKCEWVIVLSPKSCATNHWDNVIESGMTPSFEIRWMTNFKGAITTPILLWCAKRLPPFHQPMTSKEKKTLFKQYIDRLVQERCHIQEWRKAFAYSAEHPELTANEVFEAIGWKPE